MTKSKTITLNVIAPLLIGDPNNMDSEASLAAWSEFANQLAEVKALGAHAVSTDIWWGLIESKAGEFSWAYYDRMVEYIIKAGLKWVPILSFHECGGNIGDTVDIPVPSYVWDRIAAITGRPASDYMYVSESGKVDKECISPWAAELMRNDKVRVMFAFQEHYASRKEHIAEITISLGPASELRYPSYRWVPYPNRGELQCFSPVAIESFRKFAITKYGDVQAVAAAWKDSSLTSESDIRPPSDPDRFFRLKHHLRLQYGWDFFDWYQDVLLAQGDRDMTAAILAFASGQAAMSGVPLGAKVSGIHWRIGQRVGNWIFFGDRLAELPAGLIRTSRGDWFCTAMGMGYRPYLMLFKSLQARSPSSQIVLHFTCLEMADGQDGQKAQSLAYSLVNWVGEEACRLGVTVKGENALERNVFDAESWERMRSHLAMPPYSGCYEGLTVLRMGDLLKNEVSRAEFSRTAQMIAAYNAGGDREVA